MAGTSIVVDLLLRARDLASAPLRGVVATVKFLDSEISVVAGKIRNALAGVFGGGLDGAIEFEAQLSKVAAKGGFTAEEMAKLKQAATDIGAKFGTTGTEAAQGMEALAAAGLNASQVMQALPPVLALAKAEGISMDAAAEKLSDSLSTVGLGFDQAARMADVLAKGANLSTTSASALAGALATAGGIAKTAGLNLEQTVAALSALANAGIKSEKAGTALQAILTQLVNPASQASRELSALGIASRDLGTVIGQLAAKGDAGNAAILAFGETAGPGLRALIGQGQQSIADLTAQLADSKGAAEEAATGISGNLKGALSALQSAWSNVKTALFDPVLEPLAKQARELAGALNDNLASGALKPVQDAIRAFADNAVAAARDFVAGFDFKAALKSVQDLATGAKDSFTGIKDAGVSAASVVQIAWNGVTSGFKTIGASLLAVASAAISNLAAIEGAAAKIGLGSVERANELQAKANELAAKAGELTQSIAQDGEDIRGAFDRLTATIDGAATGLGKVADANQAIKNSSPAAELQTINRALADYQGMADRANAAAARARQNYEAGKISAADYGRALMAAADANAELAAASERQSASERQAQPQRKASANELQGVAQAAQDTADRYGDYTAALEQSGNAHAEAIRADIELARAKGDLATAATKSVELARLEADTAKQVATAKQAEAAELAKVVTAQQAYLASVGGGTQAQQQELQILQLKLAALQAEAEQAGKTAQAKSIAAQLATAQSAQTHQATQATQDHTSAVRANSAAQEENVKHTSDGGAALQKLSEYLGQTRTQMKGLSEMTALFFEKELQTALLHSPIEQSLKNVIAATVAYTAGLDASQKALANFRQEIANANALIDQSEQKMLFASNGFRQYEAAIEIAAGKAKKAYYEQKLAAEELRISIDEMAKTGADRTGLLAYAAQQAAHEFNLLSEQDLTGLRGAISDATEKLKKLQDEARSAQDRVAELNAEIAREKGDTATADKLKLQIEQQRQIADVEAKLAEARTAQNADLIRLYEEQKRQLQELYDLKERNLLQEQRQREQQSRTPAPAATAGGASGAPAKTHRLELVGPTGRNFTAFSENDPSAFLDELEAAKRRSLS